MIDIEARQMREDVFDVPVFCIDLTDESRTTGELVAEIAYRSTSTDSYYSDYNSQIWIVEYGDEILIGWDLEDDSVYISDRGDIVRETWSGKDLYDGPPVQANDKEKERFQIWTKQS